MRWSLLLWIATLPTPSLSLMSSSRKLELREETRALWKHAYGSYKTHAFPSDELLPLSCKPQGHDRVALDNTAVNDVCGDYVLTLVDSLDSFPVLGDREGWEEAVRETIMHVSFERDVRVQVFESTIRMVGGLLSAHLLASSPTRGWSLPWYKGELLSLAHDLGRRLLPAFSTPTGIPYARVHLIHGVLPNESLETCTAGAGSLVLEFGTLSRLTGDAVFETVAKRAFYAIWNRRSALGLVGNTIEVREGNWLHGVSSTGAGIDSFFEYAAKAYVLFGEDEWWRVWDASYSAILRYIRAPDGFWYRGVAMSTGAIHSTIVDSLSAFFPGVQTLVGDLESAIKSHAVYAYQWKRYGGLPELFDINKRGAANLGYPLRPEFIESNLYLYRATNDEFYLEMAEQVLHDIANKTRVNCGLAAIIDLTTGLLEDKQPSFVTSETLKYLYLTFDEDNPFNHDDSNAVYSTEGHMLEVDTRPIPGRRRRSIPAEAPSCPAYDPMFLPETQHILLQSVGTRTDFEWARHLAGYVVKDEADEIASGRWSESGFCEIPVSEDYAVEILFAPSGDAEVIDPSSDQVSPTEDDGVLIKMISGLRFGMTRAWPGGDHFVVTRVGPYRVPIGAMVSVTDPIVLASIPAPRLERLQLVVSIGDTHFKSPALAANFGPSLSAYPPTTLFSLSQPLLPLVLSPSPVGCEPYVDSSLIKGNVLLLRRGDCSFATKSNLAALAGAKGLVIINSLTDQDIVPSADETELKLNALAPLVLVSNATGVVLEAALRGRKVGKVGVERPVEEEVPPLVLGGYTVLNVRLVRPR